MTSVSNPTHRGKAVRQAGGLLVIKPGREADLDVSDWSQELREKYEAAGLVIEGEAEELPSREEMIAAADRLGVPYDDDTTDEELAELLDQAADPKLKKADLIALAKERKIDIDESATKADIAAAINAEL